MSSPPSTSRRSPIWTGNHPARHRIAAALSPPGDHPIPDRARDRRGGDGRAGRLPHLQHPPRRRAPGRRSSADRVRSSASRLWILLAVFAGRLVLQSRLPAPHQARRRPLRGDSARDGGERRLAHAASERLQVLREAGPAVWITAAAFTAFGRTSDARLWPALTGFLGVLLVFWAASACSRPGGAVRRGGGSELRPLCRCRPYAHAGHGGSLFHVGVGIRVCRRATRPRRERAAPLDARRLGGRGARRHDKGLSGSCFPRARSRLTSSFTATGACSRACTSSRGLVVPGDCRALVHTGFARQPGVLRFFFIHEHFERFLTRNTIATSLSGTSSRCCSSVSCPGSSASFPRCGSPGPAPPRRASTRSGSCSCGAPCAGVFSASNSKLASYILPFFPALSLLVELSFSAPRRVSSRRLCSPRCWESR